MFSVITSCSKDVDNTNLHENSTVDIRTVQNLSNNLEDVLLLKFGLDVTKLSEVSYIISNDITNFIYTKLSDNSAEIVNSSSDTIVIEYQNDIESPFTIFYENGTISHSTDSIREFILDDNTNVLGKRKIDETFTDCFKREWTEFGDDFWSILAQAVHPIAIAAAIVIDCR